jgi:hypothetical protein
MRQELIQMIGEGWEVVVVGKKQLDEGRLEVIFKHMDLMRRPVEGWEVKSLYKSEGAIHAHVCLELDDEDDRSRYLEFNSRSASQRSRSEYNKELARANIENQIRRNAVQGAAGLGVYVPFNPKIVP